MTPEELCEQLGGTQNAGKLIIRQNSRNKYLAKLVGGEWQLTDLGQQLMAEANANDTVGLTPPEPEPEPAPEFVPDDE